MAIEFSWEFLRNQVFTDLSHRSWKGSDPFDGLSSNFAQPFVSGKLAKLPGASWIRLAVLQSVKRSPLNLRPLLGVPPLENAMTWAVSALGHQLAVGRGETEFQDTHRTAINRILAMRGNDHFLWGYPFPWQSRAFYLPANAPNIVISALCLRALRSSPFVNHSIYQESAQALITEFYKIGSKFFSYVGHSAVLVHNANLLGIEVLASSPIEVLASHPEWFDLCCSALQTTLQFQESTGRWSYGISGHHRWSDNFHTAYNLFSLSRIVEDLSRIQSEHETLSECRNAISTGLNYYLKNAFSDSGSARYYDNETFPIETHSAAAALVTFYELFKQKYLSWDQANKLSNEALQGVMKDNYLGAGQFAYRKWRYHQVRDVFTRWSQAWIYYGIESYLSLNWGTNKNTITEVNL
jgi:hypothetical protein